MGSDHILTVLGLLLQRRWFGCLYWLLQRLWVGVLFYMCSGQRPFGYSVSLLLFFSTLKKEFRSKFNLELFPFLQKFHHFRSDQRLNYGFVVELFLVLPLFKKETHCFFLFCIPELHQSLTHLEELQALNHL